MTPRDRKPALLPAYERYLADQQADAFMAAVLGHYETATLHRLSEHPLREVRRAAVLAIGLVGDYESNAAVGRRLLDEDRLVRTLAESAIRPLWFRDGNAELRAAVEALADANDAQRYHEAVTRATAILRQAPWFAEAWNQRAIAYHNLGKYAKSIADCHQTLELNPYHFAAASGMGQCYLKLNRRAKALECLRRALKLNPDMLGVRACVQYLQRTIEDE